jgi:hypothetical protein
VDELAGHGDLLSSIRRPTLYAHASATKGEQVIRVFVLYPEAPDSERYAEHVELSRREVPDATIRHGRILGSPTGKADYAHYFEFEFPDRDAWKASQDGLVRSAEDSQGLGVPMQVYFAEVE